MRYKRVEQVSGRKFQSLVAPAGGEVGVGLKPGSCGGSMSGEAGVWQGSELDSHSRSLSS